MIYGDILDINSLIKAFKNADNVYHLAGIVTIMPGDKSLIRKINFEGTKNVIKACIECNIRRLIYVSSIHALKEPPEGTIIDENMPFDPKNRRGEYDRTKALASIEVLKSNGNGIESIVVCPTGVIGPYDFRGSLITKTIVDFAKGKMKITINGVYDFVDVRDVAEGIILAAKKGKSGEKYILSGERVSMDYMMKILSEITNVKQPRFKIPIRLPKFIGVLSPMYYKLFNKTPRFTSYSINIL
ncbi:MAG: NAD-dependent epimerase/dehydratase family protein [Actinobacteria bacterium]|nr:NAD-dependent epimerase/dehydratase family protein [Actinomycetota bacterium]